MSKLKVIREAYEAEGFDWETSKTFITENGWMSTTFVPEHNEFNFDNNVTHIRPKKLRNLEENNGWLPIDFYFDFKLKSFNCQVILKKTGKKSLAEYNHKRKQFFLLRAGYVNIDFVSHYRIIKDIENPFY